MEKLTMKSLHTKAKLVGTVVTVAGAMLMIVYKGPVVEFIWSKGRSHEVATADSQDMSHWLMGTCMLIFSCFCWACFFILQANTLRSYPAELSLVTLICAMGAVESGAVALVMEHNVGPWRIGWDTGLVTAVYSGVVCSGITYYIQGMVMKERGPVFVTAFNPLCMIIVAVLGSIILGEEITLGRILGAAIIVIGLYALIWGKSKDQLNQSLENDEKNNDLKLPVAATDVGIPALAKIREHGLVA